MARIDDRHSGIGQDLQRRRAGPAERRGQFHRAAADG